MATTFKWATSPNSLGTTLTTELNSLANAGYSAIGTEIDNTSNLYEWFAVHVHLGSLNPTGTPYLTLFFASELASTYEDAASSTNKGFHMQVATVSLTTGSAAKESASQPFRLGPGKYKGQLLNGSGVALAASGNTVTVYGWNEQGV